MRVWIVMILMALISPLMAVDQGFLNVITGKPEAKIFVDGEYVANDFLRKYPLDAGEHYIRVEYAGKLMYAKMVTIYPDYLETITSENFVDVRTKTPNRGAIERESIRLKETKGNFGIGFQWSDQFPAKGMSLKWFSDAGLGLQVSAIGKSQISGKEVSEFGFRGIIPVGDKIFSDSNLNGYTSIGWLQRTEDDVDSSAIAGSVGIEFAFADPIYFSLEIGVSNGISGPAKEDGLLFSWGTGIHVYF